MSDIDPDYETRRLLLLGHEAIEENDLRLARVCVQRLRSLDDIEATEIEIRILRREQRHEESLEVAASALLRHPESEILLHQQACCLSDLERYEEALEQLHALRAQQTAPTTWLEHSEGLIYHRMGQHEVCLEYMSRLLQVQDPEQDPEHFHPLARRLQTRSYLALRRKDEIEQILSAYPAEREALSAIIADSEDEMPGLDIELGSKVALEGHGEQQGS